MFLLVGLFCNSYMINICASFPPQKLSFAAIQNFQKILENIEMKPP